MISLLLYFFARSVDCSAEFDSVFKTIATRSELYRAALLKWRPDLKIDRLVELSTNRFVDAEERSNMIGILPHDIMLPMKDGVKLYTVYAQPDFIQQRRDTVIIRSPYGADATENIALLWYPFGFNVVMQNERGTGYSEGNFTFWHTAADDGSWTLQVY